MSRRIGAADDINILVLAASRLRNRAAVINARALQTIHPWNVEFAPLNARGQQHRVAGQLGSIVQAQVPVRPIHPQRCRFRGETISTPKRRAWATARRARSPPVRPEGKPR